MDKVPEGFYDGKMRSFDEMCAIANHYKAQVERLEKIERAAGELIHAAHEDKRAYCWRLLIKALEGGKQDE